MNQAIPFHEPVDRDVGRVPAHLIVCEPSGRWAVALRRELGPSVRVFETRSVAPCWERLARSPGSLVVVEATAGNLEPLLAKMTRCQRDFPAARVVVVAERSFVDGGLTDREWLLREAGAMVLVTSPRRARLLAELARRHLAERPEPPREATERIWAELPWTAAR